MCSVLQCDIYSLDLLSSVMVSFILTTDFDNLSLAICALNMNSRLRFVLLELQDVAYNKVSSFSFGCVYCLVYLGRFILFYLF